MINHLALEPLVQKAAAEAASRFPDHHPVEDVEQTLWVWIYENQKTVDSMIRNVKWEGVVYNLLKKAAYSALKAEDQAVYHYTDEDTYLYSTASIRSILEVVFNYEDWQSFATILDDMPKTKKNPAHGNDSLASYADVTSALSVISEDHYNILVWKYKYGFTYDQIGSQRGTTGRAARYAHDAAVSAIQDALGGKPYSELREPERLPQRPGRGPRAQRDVDALYEG